MDALETIKTFFRTHQLTIIKQLKQQGISISLETIPDILHATNFQQRSQTHPEACDCYSSEIGLCHKIENLNCFLCGCPYYPSENPSEQCKLDPSRGNHIPYNNPPSNTLLDCNTCNHPHNPKIVETYIRKNINSLKRLSESI